MVADLVLVTGGSGFVGAQCIIALIDAGYRVRTTLRSLDRADEVRTIVRAGGADPTELEFVEADLLADAGWAASVAGCDYVLHVASPFPVMQPKDEDELVIPARDGAVRVLRAARDAGVKRVVLTSSFAAVGYTVALPPGEAYTEQDWTDPSDPGITPYVKSKAVAERAAWDFIAREGGTLELSVVNPVGIFGPALGRDLSSSISLLLSMLNGQVPALPNADTSAVDVRDVADLHVRAMVHPDAAGERFLAVAGEPMTFPEIAALLRANLGESATHVPTRVLPDWLVRFGALFNRQLKAVAPQLGRPKRASHEKAQRVLGWQPRSNEDAVLASAESLVRLGLVKS